MSEQEEDKRVSSCRDLIYLLCGVIFCTCQLCHCWVYLLDNGNLREERFIWRMLSKGLILLQLSPRRKSHHRRMWCIKAPKLSVAVSRAWVHTALRVPFPPKAHPQWLTFFLWGKPPNTHWTIPQWFNHFPIVSKSKQLTIKFVRFTYYSMTLFPSTLL